MAQAARFLVIILCVNVITVTANEMGNRESDYYNWMDEIAQAACTGVMTVDGTVYAVRRYCVASGQPACSTVCTNQGLTCFEALHVYPNQPRLSETHGEAVGEVGPWVHRYGSCGSTHCGPNYCCCRV